MDRITTYNTAVDLGAIQSALVHRELPSPLNETLQAMVQRVTAAASEKPASIYLFSADESAAARDHFSYLFARTLGRHIPSTLLVDCDFLDVGLHGLVPERDALGFLDLLLYGSSLGVITQETSGGVKVVAAGSFPVSKRMPFILGAFDEAARRLVHHAGCVVFVGPLHDDGGELHPLIGAADFPVLVRELDAVRGGAIDPIEEQISSRWESELLSVRLVGTGSSVVDDRTFEQVLGDDAAEEAVSSTPPPPPVETEWNLAELADPSPGEDAPPERPVVSAPAAEAPLERRRRGPLRWVVPVVIVAAVLAIGAWFLARRGERVEPIARVSRSPARERPVAPPPQEPAPAVPPGDTSRTAESGVDMAVAGEAAGGEAAADSARPSDGIERPSPAPRRTHTRSRVEMADTGGRTGGTVLINPEDIHVMDDLDTNWPGYFFIHISSFRESIKARHEVAFLENHEFPVFIVFLDLGAKGKWYRVYAGPFKTRDQARDVKKDLDDIPRVRFTRITQIQG